MRIQLLERRMLFQLPEGSNCLARLSTLSGYDSNATFTAPRNKKSLSLVHVLHCAQATINGNKLDLFCKT